MVMKEKAIKRNIVFVHALLEKEDVFRAILFLERGGEGQLALDCRYFREQPLRLPLLYHKQMLRLICIMIQHLEYLGTRIRNRLKVYLPLEEIFRLLSLPDIYSHSGIIPSLNFLLKKELFVLLKFYLDKNDSLSKLLESKSLEGLLDHFIMIFLSRSTRKLVHVEGEEKL